MGWCTPAGVGPHINGFQPHFLHQPLHALAVDRVSPTLQNSRHSAGSVERCSGILLINQAHQQEIARTFRHWQIVIGGPGKPNQFTLPTHTDLTMVRIDQRALFLNRTGQLFFSSSPALLSIDRFLHKVVPAAPRHLPRLWHGHL